MKINSPSRLLVDQLRDLYSVEKQVAQTLPDLWAAASLPRLQEFFYLQRLACDRQKQRLENVAHYLGTSPEGDPCQAMEGLIEGGNAHIARAEGHTVKDLILIAHSHRIYHYQIAGYEFVHQLAATMGEEKVVTAIAQSLKEEREARCELSAVAEMACSEAQVDALGRQ